MTLLEKMGHAVRTAGCESEIRAIDDVIAHLSAEKTAGIAVIGEPNSGKTALVNKLAGQEVRKATKMVMDEPPLMVTFGSREEKTGFESVVLEAGQTDPGISIYEIPLHMAMDEETGEILPLLEEMDAVIYIVSAVMPLSGADIANIGAVANRFPLLIYISRMDLIENEEERRACAAYVRKGVQEQFGGAVGEVFESGSSAGDILDRFRGISLEDIRQFHIMRLEGQAEAVVSKKLQLQLEKLDELQKEREAVQEQKYQADRLRKLEWDEFRVAMLEREQAAADAAGKKIAGARRQAGKKLAAQFEKSPHKEEWAGRLFKNALQKELRAAMDDVLADVKDRAQADAAWLASEVNRSLGVRITTDPADRQPSTEGLEGTDVYAQKPGYHKLAAAVGTGLLAGGALFGSMTLLPTCIVAIPASFVSYYFIKGSIHDKEAYYKELSGQMQQCCDKNFAGLTEEIRRYIHRYYENMAEDIRRYGISKIPEDDFADIRKRREELYGILEELSMQE